MNQVSSPRQHVQEFWEDDRDKPRGSILGVMKVLVSFVLGLIAGFVLFWYQDAIIRNVPGLDRLLPRPPAVSPESEIKATPPEHLLNEFGFEELSRRTFEPGKITLKEVLEVEDTFISYVFEYESDGRTVTGMANIPQNKEEPDKKYPVIVMLRGFVPHNIYKTGVGTRPSSRVYAANEYITLAPDFLGFGGSDKPEADVWWERLHKPVQVLDLLTSVSSLEQADPTRIGIWGHSNGGQIALSVLEITGKPYPTTLWAPVTKGFPYSVLYFTDEEADEGLGLRWELNRFEWDYDVRKFSISQYWDNIQAPILLHQGTADDAVPLEWSNEFAAKLESLNKDITYHVYQGADHNLRGGWDTVVTRDVEFFNSRVKNAPAPTP